jgi:hypothetical protein
MATTKSETEADISSLCGIGRTLFFVFLTGSLQKPFAAIFFSMRRVRARHACHI